MPSCSIVLAGGQALGAYHAGALTRLFAAGWTIDWLAGTSIGAITAALVAGNPPERREPALRAYWDSVASPSPPFPLPDSEPLRLLAALGTRLLGRPGAFHVSAASLLGAAPTRSPYVLDSAMLASLIDTDRMNAGAPRLSTVAVDLERGEQVVFDTARERLGLTEIVASASMIPDFPATERAGRLFADGGLADNAPVDIVLDELRHRDGEHTILLLDLFRPDGPRPPTLMAANARQSDLVYGMQTRRTLRAQQAMPAPRGAITVLHLAYAATGESPLKLYDYSAPSLARRWAAGEHDMDQALRRWPDLRRTEPGLSIIAIDPSAKAPA